ncbi:hypothetical protein D3C77_528270 [compost metagenome]
MTESLLLSVLPVDSTLASMSIRASLSSLSVLSWDSTLALRSMTELLLLSVLPVDNTLASMSITASLLPLSMLPCDNTAASRSTNAPLVEGAKSFVRMFMLTSMSEPSPSLFFFSLATGAIFRILPTLFSIMSPSCRDSTSRACTLLLPWKSRTTIAKKARAMLILAL